ncbi:hypothetical protein EMIHUDRAFT_123006, partial [Emiliania huxleyi CCMP1516]|uniref:AP2/ERF domain-containing protein n=2 Tax=Emiliania huxleyi TaxID=2903 RepID=A0A0D3K937_EMIH1
MTVAEAEQAAAAEGCTATAEEGALLYARELGTEASAAAAAGAAAESMTAAEAEQAATAEGLTLVRSSRSSTGFEGVYARSKGSGFRVMRKLDGRTQYIGCTATAEEGALLYARKLGTEASAAAAAAAAGAAAAAAGAAAESMTAAEAEQAATAEGLTLVRSSRSRSGFENVCAISKGNGFAVSRWVDGRKQHIGCTATAEEGALLYARKLGTEASAAAAAAAAAESMTAAEAEQAATAEGLTLVRSSRSSTGFEGVYATSKGRGFKVKRRVDGRTQYIGCTATAEEGALLYARKLGTEASAAAAAGAAAEPMTAAEAEQAAAAEGLTLVRSSRASTGFEGVYANSKRIGFAVSRRVDGRMQYIGCTATAEEGALLYARELGTEASAAAAAAAAAESMTAAEAEQAATAEGLTLVRSSRSSTGFEGVYAKSKRIGFAEGALLYARHFGAEASAATDAAEDEYAGRQAVEMSNAAVEGSREAQPATASRTRPRHKLIHGRRVQRLMGLPAEIHALVLEHLAASAPPASFVACAAACAALLEVYMRHRAQLWCSALSRRVRLQGALPGVQRDWQALYRALLGGRDGLEAKGWADDNKLDNADEMRHAWWQADALAFSAANGLVLVRYRGYEDEGEDEWRPLTQLRPYEERPSALWRSTKRTKGEAVEVAWAPPDHPTARWEAKVIAVRARKAKDRPGAAAAALFSPLCCTPYVAGFTAIVKKNNKIVADDGSVDYKGIEQVSGRHFQHVANNALQQDMFDAIVNDPKVHLATRAHFRSTKQLGAGAVLGIDVVHKDVELNDKAWLHEAQGYLNHPKGAITLATRCVGVGPNSVCIYHRTRLPGCVPCDIGEARVPRTLSLFEHLSGTHWDGCNYGGWLATGHASLNTHVTNVARAFGASAKVMEVRLGCRDPTRAHDPDTNPYQRGDGVFGNYA